MEPDFSVPHSALARLAVLLIPHFENGRAQILMAKLETVLDTYHVPPNETGVCPHCGAVLAPVVAHTTMPADDRKRYNREQAAEFLLVNVKTVGRWRNANLLPFETNEKGVVYYLHSALVKRYKEYRGTDKT